MDNRPKLKNISIVDQIKKRVGAMNFVDVTKMVQEGVNVSPEKIIEHQKESLEKFEKEAADLQLALEKETDAEKCDDIISNLLFANHMVENHENYLKQLNLPEIAKLK